MESKAEAFPELMTGPPLTCTCTVMWSLRSWLNDVFALMIRLKMSLSVPPLRKKNSPRASGVNDTLSTVAVPESTVTKAAASTSPCANHSPYDTPTRVRLLTVWMMVPSSIYATLIMVSRHVALPSATFDRLAGLKKIDSVFAAVTRQFGTE